MRGMVIAALLFAGAAQTGTNAPVYDVRFVLPTGDAYTGTTTFTVGRDGAVSGVMKIVSPTTVDAALAGTVKEGTWAFEYTYTMPEQGCSGHVKGTAAIEKDASEVRGDVTIGGGCVEEPIAATFTFTKKK